MTTQAIIRAGLRTLVASFFATCLLAAWPLSAQAGKSGGSGGGRGGESVNHQEITVSKHFDAATPKSGGNVSGGWNVKQNTALPRRPEPKVSSTSSTT